MTMPLTATWRRLAALTQLTLKDGQFVTRGADFPYSVTSGVDADGKKWFRVHVSKERTPE